VPLVPVKALQNVIDSSKESIRSPGKEIRAEDLLAMGPVLRLQREGFLETLKP